MVIFTDNNKSFVWYIAKRDFLLHSKNKLLTIIINFYKNFRYVYLLKFKLVLRETLHVLWADPTQGWVFIFTLTTVCVQWSLRLRKY